MSNVCPQDISGARVSGAKRKFRFWRKTSTITARSVTSVATQLFEMKNTILLVFARPLTLDLIGQSAATVVP